MKLKVNIVSVLTDMLNFSEITNPQANLTTKIACNRQNIAYGEGALNMSVTSNMFVASAMVFSRLNVIYGTSPNIKGSHTSLDEETLKRFEMVREENARQGIGTLVTSIEWLGAFDAAIYRSGEDPRTLGIEILMSSQEIWGSRYDTD